MDDGGGGGFPLLPSPFYLFFASNFRAITRLETLATQATLHASAVSEIRVAVGTTIKFN